MSEQILDQLRAENQELKAQIAKLQQHSDKKVDVVNEKSDKLDQLLQIMPAGVVVIGRLGVVEQCNPAATQLLNTAVVGRQWRDIVRLCFAPQADDGHEISLKDGRRVSIATTALLNNMGQLVLLTNLTETRKLQGKLAHSQRLNGMGKMMASLAHQLRTPLTAALLYTSHLANTGLSEEQRSKFALKAKNRLLNIEQQISDMLIFARGENKLQDKLSVVSLFRELEDNLDIPLAQHDADCDLFSNQIDREIVCNKELLIGALLNLVINALQACPKGTDLRIEANALGDWLVISVIDKGPGMDAKTLEQVQEPFYTTKSHGTGLGLSVAQVVAQSHNGRFEIASQLGKGTVAGFWLPFYK
jgi:two-component system sensor histidine kinase FlrB